MSRRGAIGSKVLHLYTRANVPIITAGSIRCVRGRSSGIRRILVYVTAGRVLNRSAKLRFRSSRFCLGSRRRVHRLFTSIPRTISGATIVTQRYGFSFRFNGAGLPCFRVGDSVDRFRCFERRYFSKLCGHCNSGPPGRCIRHLRCRLGAISGVNCASCCLVISSFIRFTGDGNVPINPNEKSNTNSLTTCYVNVASLSPVGCGLLFRHFLGPRHISVPSFSVSFYCRHERRIVSCMARGCNTSRITRVIAFNALRAHTTVHSMKHAVKVPCTSISTITGLIPGSFGVAVSRTIHGSPRLHGLVGRGSRIGRLVRATHGVRNVPQGASARTTNIIVAHSPISACIPLTAGSKLIMARCVVAALRRLNLLGVSFLNLQALAIVDSTSHRTKVSVGGVSVSSRGICGLFSHNRARNVFRFRSDNVGRVLVGLGPAYLRRLVTTASLCHPNPTGRVSAFIRGSHRPRGVGCTSPLLRPVLGSAFNYVICRRRMVRVFHILTKCSCKHTSIIHHTVDGGGGSIVRTRQGAFVRNYNGGGVSHSATGTVFSRVSRFTGCTFGGSRTTYCTLITCHATCLGACCPTRFVTTLLASILSSSGGITHCATRYGELNLGLTIPSVGASIVNFSTGKGIVGCNLLNVGGVNSRFVGSVVGRHGGNGCRDLFSFYSHLRATRFGHHTTRDLVHYNTLSSLNTGHHRVLRTLPPLMDGLSRVEHGAVCNRINFFRLKNGSSFNISFRVPSIPRFPRTRLLGVRGRVAKLCLSNRPLSGCSGVVRGLNCIQASSLLRTRDGPLTICGSNSRISLYNVVARVAIGRAGTKRGVTFMATRSVLNSVRVIIFPGILTTYSDRVIPSNIVAIFNALSVRRRGSPGVLTGIIFKTPSLGSHPTGSGHTSTRGGSLGRGGGGSTATNGGGQKLFLHFSSRGSRHVGGTAMVTSVFRNSVPLCCCCLSGGRCRLRPHSVFIRPGGAVLNRLKHLLNRRGITMVR